MRLVDEKIGAGTCCSVEDNIPDQKPIKIGIKETIIEHGFKHATNMDVIIELGRRELSVNEKLCVKKMIDNL